MVSWNMLHLLELSWRKHEILISLPLIQNKNKMQQRYNATELCTINKNLAVMGFVLTITSTSASNFLKDSAFRLAPCF